MKKILVLAAVAALAAPQVFAQAKTFEGFSLGANAAMARSTSKVSTGAGASSASADDTGVDLQAQYGWALGDQFVLGVGLTAGTVKLKAGTVSSIDYYTRDRYSLDITPGFAVSDNLLVYGKLSALGATTIASHAPDINKDVTGVGYGLGLRAMMNKNFFVQAGYDWNNYNEVTVNATDKLEEKTEIFSLGAGYKF